MSAPSRATPAGRAYLDLRNKARHDHRPVDELLQLYVLEGFLARLAASGRADQFVLKGGVLLAAFDERRPTRDVDLQAQVLDNDAEVVRAAVCEIAGSVLDDGVIFEVEAATAEVIRDEDPYAGVRVTMGAQLATARPHFHVDVNVGDPITPAPTSVHVPRLLGGVLTVRGYPLAKAAEARRPPPRELRRGRGRGHRLRRSRHQRRCQRAHVGPGEWRVVMR